MSRCKTFRQLWRFISMVSPGWFALHKNNFLIFRFAHKFFQSHYKSNPKHPSSTKTYLQPPNHVKKTPNHHHHDHPNKQIIEQKTKSLWPKSRYWVVAMRHWRVNSSSDPRCWGQGGLQLSLPWTARSYRSRRWAPCRRRRAAECHRQWPIPPPGCQPGTVWFLDL